MTEPPQPLAGASSRAPRLMSDKLGICQWFHYEDKAAVDQAVALMRELGLKHLRTGVSWADFVRPGGRAWYDWQMSRLEEFHVLLSVWHTPPSIAEGAACSGPPRRLKDFADFIDLLIGEYGGSFAELELWNEPNNRLKWDFANHDPQWRKFGEMISMAAHWAQQCGKTTVLGGMVPVDHHWLNLMKEHGALPFIDVVAIHDFPEMWWDDAPSWSWRHAWEGWERKVAYIAEHAEGRPIWITETGLATWDLPGARHGRYALQCQRLEEAAAAPAERVYWYSLIDLDPQREAIEGFHVDENEYHLGLVDWQGRPKPSFDLMRDLLAQPVAWEGSAAER